MGRRQHKHLFYRISFKKQQHGSAAKEKFEVHREGYTANDHPQMGTGSSRGKANFKWRRRLHVYVLLQPRGPTREKWEGSFRFCDSEGTPFEVFMEKTPLM